MVASKRKRDEVPWWWESLKDDMERHGGFLHPCLGFASDTRELTVLNELDVNTTDDSTMLCIPRASMITCELAISLITPWWPTIVDCLEANSKEFYTPICDLILAIGLASVSESTTTIDDRETSLAAAYLETLPDDSSYWNGLPRRWSDEQLQERLLCSPLLGRAREAKRGVKDDFSFLQRKFAASSNEKRPFPISFGKFSDMLAAVSSRAFVLDENNTNKFLPNNEPSHDDVAMIPILDLCNHCRGGKNLSPKKNVSYNFQGGSMVVKAVALDTVTDPPLGIGDALRLTYGAQGNPQLLLNYGFTISYNLEPDGSSNDILEFRLHRMKDNFECLINLRTGPKSYTYGSFTKAVEFLRMDCDNQGSSDKIGEDEPYDMKAFLDDQEEHEDENDDDEDGMDLYGEATQLLEGTDKRDDRDEQEDLQKELKALSIFREAMQSKLQEYNRKEKEIIERLSSTPAGPEHYSALLLQSERRTLHFFAIATSKIQCRLEKTSFHELSGIPESPHSVSDNKLVEAQTDELAKAYVTIRHSALLQ